MRGRKVRGRNVDNNGGGGGGSGRKRQPLAFSSQANWGCDLADWERLELARHPKRPQGAAPPAVGDECHCPLGQPLVGPPQSSDSLLRLVSRLTQRRKKLQDSDTSLPSVLSKPVRHAPTKTGRTPHAVMSPVRCFTLSLCTLHPEAPPPHPGLPSPK